MNYGHCQILVVFGRLVAEKKKETGVRQCCGVHRPNKFKRQDGARYDTTEGFPWLVQSDYSRLPVIL